MRQRTVRRAGAAAAAVLSMLITACAVVGGTAVMGRTASVPPRCTDAPAKLLTPTGRPLLTVTQGANHWIANLIAEPLALAVYADGTVIGSLAVGQANERLAPMVIGHVPSCVLAWGIVQVEALSTLPMGEPEITDQGITEVTYQPPSGMQRTIDVYAFGDGDRYVSAAERANRSRLTGVLAALRQPLSGAAAWTPDRLRLVQGAPGSGGLTLVWPGPVPLAKVLTGRRMKSRPCGEVSGADAIAVQQVLGDRYAYSTWTDGTLVTGLNIGALVPGQSGCDA